MATQSDNPQSASLNRLQRIAPKLAQLSEDVLFGDIWERPNLSKRDRSLITIAALISLYRVGQLPGHIQRGLDNGLTPEDIGEVITHIAFYAGWPCAAQAAAIASDVLANDQ